MRPTMPTVADRAGVIFTVVVDVVVVVVIVAAVVVAAAVLTVSTLCSLPPTYLHVVTAGIRDPPIAVEA